jgi:hypothetical protein
MTANSEVALNVTRTRVTVLGFLMSIILFAIGAIASLEGTPIHQAIGNELRLLIPLFIAFTFAFVSLGLFIVSQNTRTGGNSDIWFYSLGEVLMFIALAQGTAGVLLLFMSVISTALIRSPEVLFSLAEMTPEFRKIAAFLFEWIFWIAAGGWFSVVYLIPVLSFHRNPLPHHKTWILYLSYFGLLFLVFWVTGVLYRLLSLEGGEMFGDLYPFIGQVIQPILWR